MQARHNQVTTLCGQKASSEGLNQSAAELGSRVSFLCVWGCVCGGEQRGLVKKQRRGCGSKQALRFRKAVLS